MPDAVTVLAKLALSGASVSRTVRKLSDEVDSSIALVEAVLLCQSANLRTWLKTCLN